MVIKLAHSNEDGVRIDQISRRSEVRAAAPNQPIQRPVSALRLERDAADRSLANHLVSGHGDQSQTWVLAEYLVSAQPVLM